MMLTFWSNTSIYAMSWTVFTKFFLTLNFEKFKRTLMAIKIVYKNVFFLLSMFPICFSVLILLSCLIISICKIFFINILSRIQKRWKKSVIIILRIRFISIKLISSCIYFSESVITLISFMDGCFTVYISHRFFIHSSFR